MNLDELQRGLRCRLAEVGVDGVLDILTKATLHTPESHVRLTEILDRLSRASGISQGMLRQRLEAKVAETNPLSE